MRSPYVGESDKHRALRRHQRQARHHPHHGAFPARSAALRASCWSAARATPFPPAWPAGAALRPSSSRGCRKLNTIHDGVRVLPADVYGKGRDSDRLAVQSERKRQSEIITGIILFFMLGCEFFINYKVQLPSRRKGGVDGMNDHYRIFIQKAIGAGHRHSLRRQRRNTDRKIRQPEPRRAGHDVHGRHRRACSAAFLYENAAANPLPVVGFMLSILAVCAAGRLRWAD